MKYRKERRKTIEDVSCKEAATGSFYAGIFIGNFICQSGSGAVCSGGRDFQRIFLKQYRAADILTGEYIWYLLQVRLLPFLVLLGSAFTKFRKAAVILFLIWTGFSAGLLFSMAVLGMGVKGSILCIAGMLPQFLCYIPAYLIVVWYAYCYPRMQWNIQKSLVSGGLLLVGIVLELYVNPVLVGAFLKTL